MTCGYICLFTCVAYCLCLVVCLFVCLLFYIAYLVVVVEVFNQTNVKRISPKSTNKNTTNQSIYISIEQSVYKVLTDNSVYE